MHGWPSGRGSVCAIGRATEPLWHWAVAQQPRRPGQLTWKVFIYRGERLLFCTRLHFFCIKQMWTGEWNKTERKKIYVSWYFAGAIVMAVTQPKSEMQPYKALWDMPFQTTVLCVWGTVRRLHKEEAQKFSLEGRETQRNKRMVQIWSTWI